MILTYGIVTLLLMIAFVGLCVWVYTPSRRARFMKDANSVFAEEPHHTAQLERNKNE